MSLFHMSFRDCYSSYRVCLAHNGSYPQAFLDVALVCQHHACYSHALYGVFAGPGTSHVWVYFVILPPQPGFLNECRGTREADGLACGIVGKTQEGLGRRLLEGARAMWRHAHSALWSSLLVLLGGHPGARWPAN